MGKEMGSNIGKERMLMYEVQTLSILSKVWFKELTEDKQLISSLIRIRLMDVVLLIYIT